MTMAGKVQLLRSFLMSIVRAERVDFQVAPGYAIEFYRLPNGEKRIGQASAAMVCGLAKSYIYSLRDSSPNRLKTLMSQGFTGSGLWVTVDREKVSGASRSNTMSLDDFKIFVSFAAFDLGKTPAKAIVRGLVGVALESIARQAFGESGLSLEEIRSMLCRDYAKTVDWRMEDLEDAETIDNHMIFLQVI
jgi:hypothetical protein